MRGYVYLFVAGFRRGSRLAFALRSFSPNGMTGQNTNPPNNQITYTNPNDWRAGTVSFMQQWLSRKYTLGAHYFQLMDLPYNGRCVPTRGTAPGHFVRPALIHPFARPLAAALTARTPTSAWCKWLLTR